MAITTTNPTGPTPARLSRRVRALWAGSLETIVATRSRRGCEHVVNKLTASQGRLSEDRDAAVSRELDVSEVTYHGQRNQFGGLKAEDAKLLEDLERENATLKCLFDDAAVRLEQVTTEMETAALKGVGWRNF